MVFGLILTNKIKVEANQVNIEYIDSSGQMDADQLCLNRNQKLTFFYQMVPLQNPAPHILLLLFPPFSEHSDVQIQSLTGCASSEGNGVTLVLESSLWTPHFIYSETLPYAHATAPTSGKKLIFDAATGK